MFPPQFFQSLFRLRLIVIIIFQRSLRGDASHRDDDYHHYHIQYYARKHALSAGTGAERIVIPPHQPQYEADHRKEESEYTEADGFGVIRRGVPLVCIQIVSALRRRLSAVLSRITADGLSLPRLLFIESEQIAAVLRLTFTCLPLQRCAAVAAKFV